VGVFDEFLHDVLGIRPITYKVHSAQKREELAPLDNASNSLQPFSGVFAEEPQSSVRCGSTPNLQSVEAR